MLEHVFKLQPSRIYLCLLAAFFSASLIIILCLPLTVLMKLSLAVLIGGYGANTLWVYGLLRGQQSILALHHQMGTGWIVDMPVGAYPAELLGDSTVTGWLAILRFRLAGRRWPLSCLVFRDSLVSTTYYSFKLTLLSSRA